MARHNKTITELNQVALKENRGVRWAYLEESLRLEIVEGFHRVMNLVGVTQKQLAERSETTQPMISRLLSGEDSRSPTLETLVKVADALNARLDIRVVERSADEAVTWESEFTQTSEAPTEWSEPRRSSRGLTAQVVPANRRWRYAQRPLAGATYEPGLQLMPSDAT